MLTSPLIIICVLVLAAKAPILIFRNNVSNELPKLQTALAFTSTAMAIQKRLRVCFGTSALQKRSNKVSGVLTNVKAELEKHANGQVNLAGNHFFRNWQ